MFFWAIKVHPRSRCSTWPRDPKTCYTIPGLNLRLALFSNFLGEKVCGSSKLPAPTSDTMVQGQSLPWSIGLFCQAYRYFISRYGVAYQCISTLVPASKLGCPLKELDFCSLGQPNQSRLGTFVASPYVKFLSHAVSFIMFLFLLVLSSVDRFEWFTIKPNHWFIKHQQDDHGRFTQVKGLKLCDPKVLQASSLVL